MEAIMLGSRSIMQDRFFQKEQEEKYRKHQESIKLISRERQPSVRGWEK